jgi:hypothetical protein
MPILLILCYDSLVTWTVVSLTAARFNCLIFYEALIRDRVTLLLAVYRQSVRLADMSLETHDQYFFQLNTCGYSPYVTSPLTRGKVCRFQLLLALARVVILTSESRGTHDHILLSQIRDSPNLEGQVPILISPRNRVAQLYPQTLGSLFVTSYDSQGWGGGIRPHFHKGVWIIK